MSFDPWHCRVALAMIPPMTNSELVRVGDSVGVHPTDRRDDAGPRGFVGARVMRRGALLALVLAAPFGPIESRARAETPSTASAPSPTDETAAAVAREPSDHELFFNVGFSHWYGGTFGAPAGYTTPALVVGVRPGLSLLELRAHYTVSVYDLPLPGGEEGIVGFGNLDVLFSHEIRRGEERMLMGFGPSGGFVHTRDGFGLAFGAVLAARMMIDLSDSAALGPFFDARAQWYKLPNSDKPVYDEVDGRVQAGHSDAQLQVGVAVSFW